jgi:hypothetical protein
VSSGVGGGLSGLVIQSTTTGDTGVSGGNKVAWTALEVPPGFKVTGVRVCYENSNPRTFIDQVRLAQVQNPPSKALVLLDDPTHLNHAGPICVDSQSTPPIDAQAGALLLDLRVNFESIADKIVVRGLGLHLFSSQGSLSSGTMKANGHRGPHLQAALKFAISAWSSRSRR